MRIKLDENLSKEAAEIFRLAGHDTESVFSKKLKKNCLAEKFVKLSRRNIIDIISKDELKVMERCL
jgi:hypothetical protein